MELPDWFAEEIHAMTDSQIAWYVERLLFDAVVATI